MIWLALLVMVAIIVITGTVYMTVVTGRFAPLARMEKRWQRVLLSLLIVACCFAVAAMAMSVVNAIIVFIHAIVFFMLFGLIDRIIRAVRKSSVSGAGTENDSTASAASVSRTEDDLTVPGTAAFGDVTADDVISEKDGAYSGQKRRINWPGWLAIITCVAYMSVAYYLCANVWETDYDLETSKKIGELRIAMFADSHMGTTFGGKGFADHIETIKKQKPDIVLIPGDYVDDGSNKKEMKRACKALGTIDAKYGVWFCYGNHDEGYFNSRDFSASDLENEFEKNGVHVLKDEFAYAGNLCIAGRRDVSMGERKDMTQLLDGADRSKYMIVLDHEPTDYEGESASDADLVLSGHTHGGQLFPINGAGEWFGINDRTYGYEKRNGTDFIVTSGISDWELIFKTGTKSEYVIIDVKGK